MKKLFAFYMNFSITTKLLMMITGFSFWIVATSAIGIWSARQINDGVNKSNNFMKETILMGSLKNDFLHLRIALSSILLAQDEGNAQRSANAARQRFKSLDGGIASLHKGQFSKEQMEALNTLITGYETYQKGAGKLISMAESARNVKNSASLNAAALYLEKELTPLAVEPYDALTDLIESTNQKSIKLEQYDRALYKKLLAAMIVMPLTALALGVLFGWLISRSIAIPLINILQTIDAVANGNLAVKADARGGNEMGKLAVMVNRMIVQIRFLIASISQNSTIVNNAAESVYGNSIQISTATEEIAAQAETVASASGAVNYTANDIAANCQSAATQAGKAQMAAEEAACMANATTTQMKEIARQVAETSSTINSLGERSSQIGEIVSTIEDIADQTNLLALNAAIEAARAGEQGRGFAVVADEVRKLADRTTTATKQISEMVRLIQDGTRQAVEAMEKGVTKVEAGSQETAKSGMTLQNIMEQINQLTEQILKITKATEEQQTSTAEISRNIEQISEVTHDSAQQIQENARFAKEMTSMAENLEELVKQFSIGGSSAGIIIDTAREDHKAFVNRVKAATDGDIQLRQEDMPDHRTCRFGKWYYGSGNITCAHLPTYKEIEHIHEQIHTLAKEALRYKQEGNESKADEVMKKVTSLSEEIALKLNELQQEAA